MLYKLMFYKKNNNKPKKDYNDENPDENNIFEELNTIIKISGMIIVNKIISDIQPIYDATILVFGFQIFCMLVNAGVILLLGYLFGRHVNDQCCLLFSSISFFLFSIDITVKYFAYRIT
jgi:hypothetical protein